MRIGQGHNGPEDQRVMRPCDTLSIISWILCKGLGGGFVLYLLLIFDLCAEDPLDLCPHIPRLSQAADFWDCLSAAFEFLVWASFQCRLVSANRRGYCFLLS